jgi:hypothetical protein
MFIFDSDMQTRNNIRLIQESNKNYTSNRDMFIIPPPKDVQSRIYDLLKNRS